MMIKELEEWIQKLKTQINGKFGNKYDIENLKFSIFIIRNSLGPNLLKQVISLARFTVAGPAVFLTIIY